MVPPPLVAAVPHQQVAEERQQLRPNRGVLHGEPLVRSRASSASLRASVAKDSASSAASTACSARARIASARAAVSCARTSCAAATTSARQPMGGLQQRRIASGVR